MRRWSDSAFLLALPPIMIDWEKRGGMSRLYEGAGVWGVVLVALIIHGVEDKAV